jgi:hypothetical protein
VEAIPATVDGVRWEAVEIYVDARPTLFEMCQFDNGYWSATGRVTEADITIESRGVPPNVVGLERIPYPPAERPTRH